MTFLDAKLQGFGDHAGDGHGLNITKHLAGSKMFHLSRFNLHVNEEACHRDFGSNQKSKLESRVFSKFLKNSAIRQLHESIFFDMVSCGRPYVCRFNFVVFFFSSNRRRLFSSSLASSTGKADPTTYSWPHARKGAQYQ